MKLSNEELEALAVRCETEAPSRPLDLAISIAIGETIAEEYGNNIGAAEKTNKHNWLLIIASDIEADGLAFVKLGDPSVTPTREVVGVGGKTLALTWCAAGLRSLKTLK